MSTTEAEMTTSLELVTVKTTYSLHARPRETRTSAFWESGNKDDRTFFAINNGPDDLPFLVLSRDDLRSRGMREANRVESEALTKHGLDLATHFVWSLSSRDFEESVKVENTPPVDVGGSPEIEQYKEGDRVMINAPASPSWNGPATVVSVNKDVDVVVVQIDDRSRHLTTGGFSVKDLTPLKEEPVRRCSCGLANYGAPGHEGHTVAARPLVSEATIAAARRLERENSAEPFKVGDTVEVVHAWGANYIHGQKVTLTEVNADQSFEGIPHPYGFTAKGESGTTYASEVKAVGEPTPTVEALQEDLAAARALVETLQGEKTVLQDRHNTMQSSYYGAIREHEADIATIGEALIEESNRRDWCSEYDTFINEVNGNLHRTLPERENEYEVTMEVTFSFTRTVTARDEDSARDMAQEDSVSPSDLDSYQSADDVTVTDVSRT